MMTIAKLIGKLDLLYCRLYDQSCPYWLLSLLGSFIDWTMLMEREDEDQNGINFWRDEFYGCLGYPDEEM